MKNIITDKIVIQENITPEIEKFIAENFGSTEGCVICDCNTDKIARDYLSKFCAVSIDIRSYHADEFMIEAYDEIVKNRDYAYFIACGAGTIHDITRVLAHKYNKPFISFPTAASVDGFVSGIAPITAKSGMKITLRSAAPVALFADINILADAPRRLTASGTGDLAGKYIALADWRIAHLLTGEEIDGEIIRLVYQAVNKVAGFAEDDYNGEDYKKEYKKFCAELLDALVLSGLCMQSAGHSRPASGAEHHIAHFLEMNILPDIFGENSYLHGENVAAGAILCAELYHKFAGAQDIKFIENYALDESLIKKYYGGLSDEIIKENSPPYLHKITPEIFYKNLGGMRDIIRDIPSAGEIRRILAAGAGFSRPQNKINQERENPAPAVREPALALELAPYVRNRFTLLKLCRCLEF